MKTLIKKLEPAEYDKNQWQRKPIFHQFISLDCQQVRYQGDALVSVQGEAHSIEFKARTRVYRLTEVEIPLYVTSDASIQMCVNEKVVDTYSAQTAAAGAAPQIFRLRSDITKFTEAHVESLIRLETSYGGQSGQTTILLDNDEPKRRPQLSQAWSWSFAAKAIAFMVLAWGSLLGLAIFLIANTKSLVGNVVTFWGSVVTVLVWFSGIFGLTDFAKIPIRDWVRQFYGWARPYRARWISTLSIVFVLASIGVYLVVYCSYIRYRYTKLINEVLESKSEVTLRRAFIRQPWRKEAQVIFEAHAYTAAHTAENFRKYIREFTSDPEIKQAIAEEMGRRGIPYCLAKDKASTFSDPVVWYASILPEGETHNEIALKNEAIKILASRNDPADVEAKLLKTILELNVTEDKARTEALIEELNSLLKNNSSPGIEALHTYQVAWDTLGQYALDKCSMAKDQNDLQNANKAVGDAVFFFNQTLDIRMRFTEGTKETLWHRPPSKLLLHHLFRYFSTNKQPAESIKNHIDNIFGRCPEFVQPFKSNFVEKFDAYVNGDAWLSGTPRKDDYRSYVQNTLLNKGWRY